ncbi:MAG: hypothetical protein Q9187_003875 [Circinaria calcarea]
MVVHRNLCSHEQTINDICDAFSFFLEPLGMNGSSCYLDLDGRPAPPSSPLSTPLPVNQSSVPTSSAHPILPIWPAFHQSFRKAIWEMYIPPFTLQQSYAQKLERARQKLGPVLIPEFNSPRRLGNQRRHSATPQTERLPTPGRRHSASPLAIEDLGQTIEELREVEEFDTPSLVRAIRDFIPPIKTHNALKAHYNNTDFKLFEAMEANESLGSRNDELEDEVAALTAKLNLLDEDKKVSNWGQFAKDIEAKKNDQTELEAQNKYLQNELARLGTVELSKDLVEKRNQKLYSEVETLESRVGQLKVELELCQKHRQGLENQISDVRDDLTRKLEDQDSLLKSVQATNGVQEGEISELKLKNDDLEKDLRQCEEHSNDLEKRLAESQDTIAKLLTQVADLEKDKELADEGNASAQSQREVLDLNDRLRTLQRDNRGLTHVNGVLKQQLEEKEQESQRTEKNRQDTKDQSIARYRKNCEGLLRKLQATESDLTREKETGNLLRESMKNVAEELEHSQQAGPTQKDLRNDNSNKELKICRNHGKKLEKKLVEEKGNTRRFQEMAEGLRQELDALRDLYTGAGKPSSKSGSQIWIDLTVEKNELAKQVKKLTEQLDSQGEEMNRLIEVAANAKADDEFGVSYKDKRQEAEHQAKRIAKLEEQIESCREEIKELMNEIATSHKQLRGLSTSIYKHEKANRELKDQELSHRWRKHQRSINAIIIRLVASLQDRSPDFEFAREHIAQAERDLLMLHRCYEKEIKAVDEDIYRAATILEQDKLTGPNNAFIRERDIQAGKDLKALHTRYSNEIDAVSHDIDHAWLYLQQQDELMQAHLKKPDNLPEGIVSVATKETSIAHKGKSIIASFFKPMEQVTTEKTHQKAPSPSLPNPPSPSNPDCKSKCAGLTKALDKCCEELANLTAQVTSLQKDNADLQDRLDTQDTTFRKQALDYVAASHAAETKYQTARAAFQELGFENNTLKQEKTALQQEVTALKDRGRPNPRRQSTMVSPKGSPAAVEGTLDLQASPAVLEGAQSPKASPEMEVPRSPFPPGTIVSRDSWGRIRCVVAPPINNRPVPEDPYYSNLVTENNSLINENTRFRKRLNAISETAVADALNVPDTPPAPSITHVNITRDYVDLHGLNRELASEYNGLVDEWTALKNKYARRKIRYRALTKECRRIVWCDKHPLFAKEESSQQPESPQTKSKLAKKRRFPRRPATIPDSPIPNWQKRIYKLKSPPQSSTKLDIPDSSKSARPNGQSRYRLSSSSPSSEREEDGEKDLFTRRRKSRSGRERKEKAKEREV